MGGIEKESDYKTDNLKKRKQLAEKQCKKEDKRKKACSYLPTSLLNLTDFETFTDEYADEEFQTE